MYITNHILEKFYYDKLILKFTSILLCLIILFFISYYLFFYLLYPNFIYQDCANFKNACDDTNPLEPVFSGWAVWVCYPWLIIYFERWKHNKLLELNIKEQILKKSFEN